MEDGVPDVLLAKASEPDEREALAAAYKDIAARDPSNPPLQAELADFSKRFWNLAPSDRTHLLFANPTGPEAFIAFIRAAGEASATYKGEGNLSEEEARQFKADLLTGVDRKLTELIPPASTDAVMVTNIKTESGASLRWAAGQIEVTKAFMEGRPEGLFAVELRFTDIRIVSLDMPDEEQIILIQNSPAKDYQYEDGFYLEKSTGGKTTEWVFASASSDRVSFGVAEAGEEPALTQQENAKKTLREIESIKPPEYLREAHLSYIKDNLPAFMNALARGIGIKNLQ